jgi:molybdate transport system ATP-binding protein
MQPKAFITLDDITVRIGGRWLLKGLSWQINRHEHWIIWGPNGSGKTTLAKTLMDTLPVVQGGIVRHYINDTLNDFQASHMALVSSEQHTHLYLREQLLEEMAYFSANPDLTTKAGDVLFTPASVDDRHRGQMIHRLGLDPILTKQISALSTGEMRKLLIGRALLAGPRMLILDEPFNGLDKEFQKRFIAILHQLEAHGVQMVLITHRPKEIPGFFTHLLHLEQGVVKWTGPVQSFFKSNPLPSSKMPGKRSPADRKYFPELSYRNGGPNEPPLICMENIFVKYGSQQVLSGINWTVRAGENWALTGPNGAGKSTLLRLITGDDLQGYANKLMLFGRRKGSGESVWEIKQQIGYVSDEVQLRYQKKMSGFDVVCSGFFDSIGLYRHCTHSQKQTALQWFRKTGAEHLSRPFFSKLSFGQKRMVLILRAMVKTPRLLILDEPCNGLDQANRQKLLEMLDIIGRSAASNLIYVSHRLDEVPDCITHRLRIEAGQMVDLTVK